MFCRAANPRYALKIPGQVRKQQLYLGRVSAQCQKATKCSTTTCTTWMNTARANSSFIPLKTEHDKCYRRVYCRYLATTVRLQDQKQYELTTKPFGHLALNTTGNVNTQINCLDPQKYPLQNKVILSVETREGVVISDNIIELEQEENSIKLTLHGSEDGNEVVCLTNLPVKFDVDAHIKDRGHISMQKFENDEVNISIEDGGCRLKNIQTGEGSFCSTNGDITCEGVIQGNSSIKATGNGNVKVHRVQGLSFSVETNSGEIEAKAMYADESDISTTKGNIHIGSCHGKCSITAQQSGNINIDSLDGDLGAKTAEGDVTIGYVARHEAINIETGSGNVDLKLADSQKTSIDIEAKVIDLSPDFDILDGQTSTNGGKQAQIGLLVGGAANEEKAHRPEKSRINNNYLDSELLGTTQRHLVVRSSNGHVNLSCADWFSSLKLMSNVD